MSQDEYIRTALRVPPDLHKALHEAADAHGRSFNAEIIARLLDSFKSNIRWAPTGGPDSLKWRELVEAIPSEHFEVIKARITDAIVQATADAVVKALESPTQVEALRNQLIHSESRSKK